MTRCLVTGATGFVGSHIAERCVAEGFEVRALVRHNSDTSLLEEWGVKLVEGDLLNQASLERGMAGVDYVFHAAAKVGDWGAVDAFRRVNVDGLETVLDAACRSDLKRFVHISSLGVYRNGHHYGTDESVTPTIGADDYANTKIEGERMVVAAHTERGLPITVFRPGFIYGPRDRNVLPRLLDVLHKQRLMFLGDGKQKVNSIYVKNLVDAVFLALAKPASIGQIYNVTDAQGIDKREFISTVAQAAGFRVPRRHVPLWVGVVFAEVFEALYRLARREDAPILNKARVKFLGLNLDFSCAKAQRQLGYAPRVKFHQAMRDSVEWFRHNGHIGNGGGGTSRNSHDKEPADV